MKVNKIVHKLKELHSLGEDATCTSITMMCEAQYINSDKFHISTEWTHVDCPKCLAKRLEPVDRKRVQTSHLAMRFYACDGWTYAELKSCILSGDLYYQYDPNETIIQYWILDHTKNSKFDIKKLASKISEIDRIPCIYDDLSIEEYIEKYNGF